MKRAACLTVAALVAMTASAAAGPPLASTWNIAASGKAASSGDLDFRITAGDGSNPVEISVPVISGASEDSVARSIQRSLSSQLPRHRYSVQLGEGGNVMVSDPRGEPNFSLELMDSSIENVRVVVRSAQPVAPPTVPTQATPANPPATPATPPAPGDVAPPESSAPPANASQPAAPPPQNSPPLPNPTAPPETSGAGAEASAPPPR
jgi:hypothetical protein